MRYLLQSIAGEHGRRVRWPILLLVLVAIPLAAVWGDWAIFNLFGNGHYLPFDSAGSHVLRWWDGWGRPVSVAAVSWLVLAVYGTRVLKSVSLALVSAAASFFWLYAVFFVVVATHPGILD